MQTAVEFTVSEMGNGVFRVSNVEKVGGAVAIPSEALLCDTSNQCFDIALRDACEIAGVDVGAVVDWTAYMWSRSGPTVHIAAFRGLRTELEPGEDL